MEMETPPRELRKRLQRSQETNQYLEAELAELREFTKLESQFMLLEEGCSKLGDELATKVDRLTKSHAEFKSVLLVKCDEKKKYLVDLAGKSHGIDVQKEIAIAFEDLASFLEEKPPSKNAAPAGCLKPNGESLLNSQTLDMIQTELSKIRSTLKGPRRLSDSSLVVERFRKPKAVTRRSASSQTEALEGGGTENVHNLLDLSITTLQDGAGDKLPDLPPPSSEALELSKELSEMKEECSKLTLANHNLKLVIEDKCEEIQELLDLLDETRASCTCKPLASEGDNQLNRSDFNESRRNLSSYLPTILEASFDGSDQNDSSFAPERNPLLDSDPKELELRDSSEISVLQKCNDFLSSELNYCLGEVENKDEQVRWLQALAVPSVSPDLEEICNRELEDLESVFSDSDGLNDDSIKSEVVSRLENALCSIKKYIDSSLSSPKFDFSPDFMNGSSLRINESTANESLAVLADASFPQQLCNAVFNASSNTLPLDASVLQNPEHVKLCKMMNDARNLRNCSLAVISNFSLEVFKAVKKLARMESMIQRLKSDGSDDVANIAFYKGILLKEIKEKADAVFGVHDATVNHSFSSPITNGLSAACSADDTLHFSLLTDSKLQTTSDSLHLSVLTGDKNQTPGEAVSFNVMTDDEKLTSEILAVYSCVDELSDKLKQLGFINPKTESSPSYSESVSLKSIALRVEELGERLNRSNNQHSSFRYDPECTQFLSMDVSTLTGESPARRVLQTSQFINQNETSGENKENVLKNTIRNYNKLIVDSKVRIEELEVARSDAEMKLSQKSSECHLHAEEIETLQSELILKNLEVSEKLTEIRRLKELIGTQEEDLKGSKHEIDGLKEELRLSKLNQAELALASEALSEKISDLELKLVASDEKGGHAGELEDGIKTGALEKNELRDDLQRMSEDLGKATVRNSELVSKLELLQAEKDELESALRLSSEELEKASERISELEKAATEKEALQQEFDHVMAKLAQSDARLAELEGYSAAFAMEKETLQRDNDRMQNELAVTSEKLSDACEKRSDLASELAISLEEKKALENKLVRLSEETSELTDKLSSLKLSVSGLESEKEAIGNELATAISRLSQAEAKIVELEDADARANSYDGQDLQNEMDPISGELSKATERNAELERERVTEDEHVTKSTKLEKEVSVLNELIQKTRNGFSELIKFSSERLGTLMLYNRELQLQLCMETAKNNNVITGLTDKLAFAEAEIAELESGLCSANAQMLMKQHKLEELEGMVSDRGELFARIKDLETLSSQLSSSLNVAKDNMAKLIRTSSHRISELETSCKSTEIELSVALAEKRNLETKLAETTDKLIMETMDREKLAAELEDSMVVLRALQKSEETKNERLKSQLDESDVNLRNLRMNFTKQILDSKQYIDELRLSNRLLSMNYAEESNAKSKLVTELKAAEMMITQLKEFIESTQSCEPRNSSKDDCSSASCTPLSRSTRSASILDRSGNTCAYLGADEASYANNTVNFERSIFVSELPMERTICADPLSMTLHAAVDPLSMTLVPEKLITPPRKMLSDDDSSDEADFGTPVAGRWGNVKYPVRLSDVEKMVRLNAAKDQIKGITNDIASLKLDVKSLVSMVPNDIAESLNTIRLIYPSFSDQVTQKEKKIAELDDANAKLRETVLTGSLERESLRDELKTLADKIEIVNSQLRDSQMDNQLLIEERDLSQMQVNSMEKTMEEVLRLWYQDELPVSEDAIQELKSLVREVSNAKNLIADHLNKPKNMNFFSEIMSLLSRSQALDQTLTLLKNEGLAKCRELKEECNQIVGDSSSLQAEIQETLRKIVLAVDDFRADDMELRSLKSQLSSTEIELDQKTACIEALKGQLKVQTDDNISLKDANLKLIDEVENVKLKNDDLLMKIDELQLSKNILSAEMSKLRDAIDEKVASKENEELEKNRELIADLEKRLVEEAAKNSEWENQVKDLEETKMSLLALNTNLNEELNELKMRDEELSVQMEELSVSYKSVSNQVASLQETIVELEEKLSSTESELTESQRTIRELTSASSCAMKSPLEIIELLSSLAASTVGHPVDLSCDHDNPFELLAHMKEVLRRSNDALNAVFSLLNTNETSGVGALESLYSQLKDSDIRDVYMCKKKFSTEINSLDPEMRVEDLVKLSLIELQTKLVSVIMEKEQVLIQNFQAEFENKLASKAHALNQYEDRERYMKEMIEDLTRENEKLEKTVSELKSDKAAKELGGEQDLHNEATLNSQKVQNLKDEIESLKENNSSLEFSSKEANAQYERLMNQFTLVLSNVKMLLEDQQVDESALTPLCQIHVNSDMKEALRNIYSEIDNKKIKDKLHKELENEHKACKNTTSALEAKLAELSSSLNAKVQQMSSVTAEKDRLEAEIEEIKRSVNPKREEANTAEKATIADLNVQLEMSAKYIEQLELRDTDVEKKKSALKRQVRDLAKERDSLKEAFSQMLSEAQADVSKTMSYVEMLHYQALNLDSRRGNRLDDDRGELESLQKAYEELSRVKQTLEASLSEESKQKLLLLDRVKELESKLSNIVHDNETCPFVQFKAQCEELDEKKEELQKLLAIETDSSKRLLEKVRAMETIASNPVHDEESCPNKKFKDECNACRSNIQKLEITLLKVSEEKDTLQEKIRVFEEKTSGNSHDEKSCPYKNKVQEYKKDLWIARTKAEEEKKNFDIMKKNLQEDLAFKSSTIKELEDRNEATINDFRQRLASSTAAYDKITQKLEEAEERISFLRDMNSQDKKRFEKDIDVLTKEISRLRTVSSFLQSIGIENDKVQETLPEIKKKLCEYDALKTALENAEEKNAELDKECDDMCAEIKLLQSAFGEKCEENEKLKRAEELLRKELEDAQEVAKKYKTLEIQLATKGQWEAELADELKLKESQLQELSRKLADESMARSQLENAFKQLETNLETRNQKINQLISQMKNYEMAFEEKSKLVDELKSTVAEKSKMLEEMNTALENEKSKAAAAVHCRNVALEEQLAKLQEELTSCKSRVGTVTELETKFHLLSKERDEALRRYHDIESQMPLVHKKMQDFNQQLSALKNERTALMKEREDAEQNWKAQRLVLNDEVNKLKVALSDKTSRIVEIESVIASQSDIASQQAKISELQDDIARLKKELAQQTSNFIRPQTTPVVVRPSSATNQQVPRQQTDYEEYHKLEKKYTVIKRLAEKRRSKILLYQQILAQHNIDVPQNEVSA